MLGVPLAHAECEVDIAVLFFGSCGTPRRLREGQIANLELLFVTEAVLWVTAINYGSNLQVKLEVETALEPWVAREVLEAGSHFSDLSCFCCAATQQ